MDMCIAVVNFFFSKQKEEPKVYSKVSPEELPFESLLTFSKKNGLLVAKFFGYREVVSDDYFIINDYLFTVGVSSGVVYQVQLKPDGSLFLQGKKEKIRFEKIRTK